MPLMRELQYRGEPPRASVLREQKRERQRQAEMQKAEKDRAEFEATYQKPGAGDQWISKEDYNNLSTKQKAAYDSGGLDALNELLETPVRVSYSSTQLPQITYDDSLKDAWHDYVTNTGQQPAFVAEELIKADAPAAVVYAYIQQHPNAIAGPTVSRFIQSFNDSLEDYNDMTDSEQFETLQELGFIPEGSKFRPEVTAEDIKAIQAGSVESGGITETERGRIQSITPQDWYYQTPEDIKEQLEQIAEDREFRRIMGKYYVIGEYDPETRTTTGGGYRLAAALAAGISEEKLRELGFTHKAIVDAMNELAEYTKQQEGQTDFEQEYQRPGAGDEWISKKDYDSLTDEQKAAYDTGGFAALTSTLYGEQAAFEQIYQKPGAGDQWITKEDYSTLNDDQKAAYDNGGWAALSPMLAGGTSGGLSADAQYKLSMIQRVGGKAAEYFNDPANVTEEKIQEHWQSLPLEIRNYAVQISPEYRDTMKDMAIAVTPVLGTVYFWNQMSPVERALSIGFDVLIFASMAGRPAKRAFSAIRQNRRVMNAVENLAIAESRMDDLLDYIGINRLKTVPLSELRAQVSQVVADSGMRVFNTAENAWDVVYAKGGRVITVGEKAQQAIVDYYKAQQAFINEFSRVSKLTSGQIRRIESVLHIEKLQDSIQDVQQAGARLNKMLATVQELENTGKMWTVEHQQALYYMERVKAEYNNALRVLWGKLNTARDTFRQQHAAWNNLITETERAYQAAAQEANNLAAKLAASPGNSELAAELREAMAAADQLNAQLRRMYVMREAGELPPYISRYKVTTTGRIVVEGGEIVPVDPNTPLTVNTDPNTPIQVKPRGQTVTTATVSEPKITIKEGEIKLEPVIETKDIPENLPEIKIVEAPAVKPTTKPPVVPSKKIETTRQAESEGTTDAVSPYSTGLLPTTVIRSLIRLAQDTYDNAKRQGSTDDQAIQAVNDEISRAIKNFIDDMNKRAMQDNPDKEFEPYPEPDREFITKTITDQIIDTVREPEPRTPDKKKPYIRPPTGSGEGGEDDWLVVPKGTVVWKQGFGYWQVRPPYGRDDKHFTIRKPEGAEIQPDMKTAAATLQTLSGKPPDYFGFNLGIVDVAVKNPPQTPSMSAGKLALSFTPSEKARQKRRPLRRFGPYQVVRAGNSMGLRRRRR